MSRHFSLMASFLIGSGVILMIPKLAEKAAAAQAKCELPNYAGNKVALVVGTDDYSVYQYDKIPNLANAANDARMMAGLLTDQGFVVRCLINPTQQEFGDEESRLTLFLLSKKLDDPDNAAEGRAVLYIAGHGYRDPDSNQDYLLFRYDPNPDKYQKVVDFSTVAGRVAEGRWSAVSLTQAFNSLTQGVIFVFDTCRAVIEVPSASGAPVRAGPMQVLPRETLRGKQVVAYSTQPGGLAADRVPNSTEQNGLYASTLSNFIHLTISSLSHALNLTNTVVIINKPDQQPTYSVSAGTLFVDNPWVNAEPTDVCDVLDSEIWNAAGRHCDELKNTKCIVKDICPVVRPNLTGSQASQAKQCLVQHKEKWLHVDLIQLCGTSQATAPAPTKQEAYNVLQSTESNPYSTDFKNVELTGWADTVIPVQLATEQKSEELLSAVQALLERRLPEIDKQTTKMAYVNKQRDFLIAKTPQWTAPRQKSPSPFKVDLTSGSITLRTLPAATAAPIDTYSGKNVTAEVDCSTMYCSSEWIGLRVKQGRTLNRGWASSEELKSLVNPALSVIIKYDGRRIAPRDSSIDELRHTIRPDASKPPALGHVYIIAARHVDDTGTAAFLPNARLSYLGRVMIDLGVDPDDIEESIVDLPYDSMAPAAIVNLGAPFEK